MTAASSQLSTTEIKTYRSVRREWFGGCVFLFLAFWILGPISTVVLWAFANKWYSGLVPQEFGVQFWSQTFARGEIQKAIPSSIFISVTVTILSIIICLPASYAFARMEFFGKRFFLLSYLITNAFPRFALYVAIAIIFFRLQLIGTVPGVILIQLVNTLLLMIWIPTAAFQGVEHSLEEAAQDVGATNFQ